LILNNTTALTLVNLFINIKYIPQWDHDETEKCGEELSPVSYFMNWELDRSLGSRVGIKDRWATIKRKFSMTQLAISLLEKMYSVPVRRQTFKSDGIHEDSLEEGDQEEMPEFVKHAIVMSHIAARRTDDAKVGVGAVIADPSGTRYISVGCNSYPKKAQHLDYPQKGADDSLEDEELKYDYILHAEQNSLLWRNPPGKSLHDAILISTKMPCDEW
jgi:deoxycytidylate deaminase